MTRAIWFEIKAVWSLWMVELVLCLNESTAQPSSLLRFATAEFCIDSARVDPCVAEAFFNPTFVGLGSCAFGNGSLAGGC